MTAQGDSRRRQKEGMAHRPWWCTQVLPRPGRPDLDLDLGHGQRKEWEGRRGGRSSGATSRKDDASAAEPARRGRRR
jgi:hypothetical protein